MNRGGVGVCVARVAHRIERCGEGDDRRPRRRETGLAERPQDVLSPNIHAYGRSGQCSLKKRPFYGLTTAEA